MNKTNTVETTLKSIKSMCAERDRKERERLRANRLDMEESIAHINHDNTQLCRINEKRVQLEAEMEVEKNFLKY